jgi:hypothetical protein
MVEDHADQLTEGLIVDLKQNPRTPAYHDVAHGDMYDRIFKVYHDLGEWLSREAEQQVEAHYTDLGKRRAHEGVPLSEVLYALIRTKNHLFAYTRRTGLFDTAVDLYQLHEFRRLVEHFFDDAIYYTARAYEREFAATRSRVTAAR